MESKKLPVVVVGAGIVGVTTALVLQRTGKYQVAVVAKNTSVDESSLTDNEGWASPFAGANWHAYAGEDEYHAQEMEYTTWRELRKLADMYPESHIKKTTCLEFTTAEKYYEPWFIRKLANSKYLAREQVPFGCDIGIQFDTVILNAPKYLHWVTQQYLESGGKIYQVKLDSLGEAIKYSPTGSGVIHITPIVVNCTGLGSLYLQDVKDTKMHPVRGQVTLVNAPMVKQTISDTPAWKYIIPRGDGTVILGGTYQANNWSTKVDPNTTEEVLRETVKMCPLLVDETTPTTPDNWEERLEKLRKRIIKINVGFRPAREGGTRIELGTVPNPNDSDKNEGIVVVHNYGHGGYGYQSSWGYAFEALKLTNSAANKIFNAHSKL
ncbi:hypothetical protein BB559_001163 [Furculomyces boomerangus]|uniref:FAD dependent oxidoreductase domain-containing protein n=2 Tax=Harpellales TaxID=61421 RepID=A0A2T9Z2Z9_9FUNG|nr:hypothetical protein BB559_001163 [Furculomyces boomerangus]PVZ98400.1 hypothetical protein BB558_005598 [Smittium angustum]